MINPKFIKIFSASILFTILQFDLFTGLKTVKANAKKVAANFNDLALYEGMGTSYVCGASKKGIDLEFKKSLHVASSTFVTVVMKKHDSTITSTNTSTTSDVRTSYNNITSAVKTSIPTSVVAQVHTSTHNHSSKGSGRNTSVIIVLIK